MTALGRLLGSPRNAGLEGPFPLTSSRVVDWLAGPKAWTGRRVDETKALESSAFFRGVTLISGTLAGLPLHAYRPLPDGGRERVPDTQAAAALLADPHPDLTPFELWELVYSALLRWGNAYLLKLRDQTGRLAELWWLDPSRVRAGRASDGTKVYIIDGKRDEAVGDDRILHIPGFSVDGTCGVGIVRLAREGLALGMAAEEFGARFFGNGSLASGILTTEQRIGTEEADEVKAMWKAGGTGLDSAHDIRVVGSGAKYERLTIPPEDAQFLQTRQFQVEEVARWLGLPPHMLAQVDKSTSWGTGIEAQQIAMIVYTFGPWLQRVEQRLTKMLRPQAVYARYSVEGLLRGDSAARASFYTALWQIGALSTNDVRRLEDMPPVEGGDVRYVPLNFGVLGEAPAPAAAATAAALNVSDAARVLASSRGVRLPAPGQLPLAIGGPSDAE